MAASTFKLPTTKNELLMSVLMGVAFAALLFVLMAVVQMLGEVKVVTPDMTQDVVAYTPPDITEIEDELPPPPEDDEPPPELEAEPPQLSLAQLDIALNPGTGGAIAGDFAMPTISTNSQSLGTEDFVDFSDLDQMPRPMPGSSLDFPRRLKRKAVEGRVVLLIKLGEDGRVLETEVESSNLPEFESIVASEVGKWRFSPPTKDGTPVRAQARFPVPIRIGG